MNKAMEEIFGYSPQTGRCHQIVSCQLMIWPKRICGVNGYESNGCSGVSNVNVRFEGEDACAVLAVRRCGII